MNRIARFHCFYALVLLAGMGPGLAGTVTTTLTTSGTWTAPVGATSVTVEAWGGGGAGGGATTNPGKGGGGAGGQYAVKVLAVTAGSNYTYVIGAGGTSGTGDGGAGGDTSFASNSVLAKGGAGGTGVASGVAGLGSATGGVGTTVFAGGSGSSSSATGSGAGGGGAGSAGAGGNASTTTAGAGTATGGGIGGAGRTTAGNGRSGTTAGGGGSGGYATSATTQTGGAGARGQIVLTFTLPTQVTTNAASALTPTTATLNGTVTSNGDITTVTFQYGLTTAYGSTASTVTGSPVAANGSNVAVSAGVSGLTPSTVFHYRIVGTNASGTVVGNDQTFTTQDPPSVTSMVKASFDPTQAGKPVTWTVTFSTSVTGVDASDFVLVQQGGTTGASITSVSGSGTTWTVSASTGTAALGTLGLNLVDDDSITSGALALGGSGAGNGNFSGQVYTLLASVCTGAADILFCDDFERSNPGAVGNGWTVTPANASNCSGVTGNAGCAGIDSDIAPFNVYTNPRANPTRSMFTRWSTVSVDSPVINLAGKTGAHLSFWMRRGADAFSEYPEGVGENYLIWYMASNMTWKILAQFPSGILEGQVFNPVIELPDDALHAAFQIRFYQPTGSGANINNAGAPGVKGTDYWHLDDVVVREVTSARYSGAFCDNFEAGLARWSITAVGAPASANIGDASIGTLAYQSAGHELDLRWGYNSVATFKTDLSGVSGNITYWVRSGTNAARDPVSSEDLVVEYFNNVGNWVTLDTFLGSVAAGTSYSATHALAADAKHAAFRLRFRQLAGSGYDKSYWHVDDVCVGNQLPTADLALSKTGGTLVPGSNSAYTLRVANNGPSALSGSMEIVDTLPTGVSYLAGTGSGWVCGANGQKVTCDWTGTLANGAVAPDLVLTVAVGSGVSGSITNTATVTGTVNDPVPGNNTASYTSGNFVPAYIFTNAPCPNGYAVGSGPSPCNLVDWSTMTAGQAKSGVYITAVNSAGIPTQLSASSTTTVGFQFGLSCLNPVADAGVQATFSAASPNALPLCASNGAEPSTWSSTSNLGFAAGSPSVATGFNFNYGDVGVVELFMRNAASTNQKATSGAFVQRPVGFVLSEIKPTANGAGRCSVATTPAPALTCATAAAEAATFVHAGEAFSVTVKALTATGSAAPNFGKEVVPESVKLNASNVVSGMVAPLDVAGNFGTFNAGVASGTAFSWSEVGIITLTPQIADGDYLGTGNVLGTTSTAVGRFVPNHFDTVVTQACISGNFTYSGQAFSTQVTARSLGGTTTLNYDSSSVTAPSFARAVTLSQAGSTTGFAFNTLAASSFAAGVGTNNAVTYTFASPQTAPLALAVRAQDTDAVSSATASGSEGLAQIRSGRLRLLNAYGSELLGLPVSLTTQYYNGLAFVLNSVDDCTVLPLPTPSVGLVFGSTGGLSAGRTTPSMVSTGNVVMTTGSATLTAGDAGFNFSAPGQGYGGYVDITVSAPAWLKFPWIQGSPPSDPTGRATFGVYKSPLIYLRENY